MNIKSISANIWSIDTADSSTHSNVPELDIIVPTTRQQHIVIILIEFKCEDSVRMSGLSSATALQGNLKFSCLLIINSHDAIGTTSCELSSIWLVVDSEELIQLIVNGV